MTENLKREAIVFDLFCGLGGWSSAFIKEGYRAIGFDIEAHNYGSGGYPGELVLRDVRSISGAELVKEYGIPACIVASPPCQEYSYMAMPWSKAKDKMRKIMASAEEQMPIPGKAHHKIESPHLWLRDPAWAGGRYAPNYMKSEGMNWSDRTKRGQDFTRVAGKQTNEGQKNRDSDGYEYLGRNFGWKAPRTTSKSKARKQASAEIAKIPYPLAQWIARCFKPSTSRRTEGEEK